MFVIGRNVEVKVEEGKLTIVCQIDGVVPTPGLFAKTLLLATTNGARRVPKTELYLALYLQKR